MSSVASNMVLRRPLDYKMLLRATLASYNESREFDGRVEWDEAPTWVQEAWLHKVRTVLEAALPQDKDILTALAAECTATVAIL